MARNRFWILLVLIVVVTTATFAQRRRSVRREDLLETGRNGVPEWPVNPDFPNDAFTFVRIEYDSWSWGGKWLTDYPDSDLNFSYRLQELTSMQVNPQPKIVRLTDDDFWGEREWSNFYEQIKRVFPDREPEELPLEHEIFHCVYDLKEKPQVPSIHAWARGYTAERYDAREPHYKAFHDDHGRMVMIICHNTDLGDGWEREGLDPNYFREMSEKYSYPLGINIIVYAMTH
jgi:hypothetical protein